jgi:hypothetical protein
MLLNTDMLWSASLHAGTMQLEGCFCDWSHSAGVERVNAHCERPREHNTGGVAETISYMPRSRSDRGQTHMTIMRALPSTSKVVHDLHHFNPLVCWVGVFAGTD